MTPPPDTRPLTSDEQERLLESATRLSELLVEAAPLIELLNAPTTLPRHRAAFAEQIGMYRFAMTLSGLKTMNSRSVWQHADQGRTRPDDS